MLDWAAGVAAGVGVVEVTGDPFETRKSTHWRHVSHLKQAFG
jgi:hypothetical protein